MCSDQSNLKALSNWPGKNECSRRQLMDKLQSMKSTFLISHSLTRAIIYA